MSRYDGDAYRVGDSERLDMALLAADLGTFDWDVACDELTWDDRLLEMFGFEPDTESGTRSFGRDRAAAFAKVHPDDVARVECAMRESVRDVGPFNVTLRIVVDHDAVRWVEVRGRSFAGADGTTTRMIGVAGDVTDRENAAFRADRALATMPVGYVSLDREWRYRVVNDEAARLSGHSASELVGRVIWEAFPALVGSPIETAYRGVRATGEPVTVEDFYPEPLNRWYDIRVSRDGDDLALHFLDVTAAREEHSRLELAAAHDRSIARALQQALLTDLPTTEHLEIAARYLAAADDEDVGGDWYDAVVGATGTTVVIGDVMGHDITAAATMGQLRGSLRTLAWSHDGSVSSLLTRLEQVARHLGSWRMTTAVVARFDDSEVDATTGAATVHWSNAGHPAPLVLHPGGETEVLTTTHTDPPLGVLEGVVRSDHHWPLMPGAVLMIYTDGLVESRSEAIDVGIERLRRTMAAQVGADLDTLLDAVLADVTGNRNHDDIAVLAVRVRPPVVVTPGPGRKDGRSIDS